MALTAWRADFGVTQGRIAPLGAPAAAGTYAFVLGSDAPLRFYVLNPGDYIQVAQLADFQTGGSEIVRFTATIRPPVEVPAGGHWRLSVRFDGAEVSGQAVVPGRTRERVDMAIDVANVTPGDHTLAFRLELLGAGGPYDLELPGVYVDQVVLESAATSPILINRDPEPGEAGVPVNQTIAVDIADVQTTTPGVSLANTEIYVDGALAFDGGVFQAGFQGPESAHSNPQADVLRVLIDPDLPFASLDIVVVRVVSQLTNHPLQNIDQSYEWTVEDITAPELSVALGTAKKIFRVTFNEPMDDTPLEPANWSIALVAGDDQTRLPAVQVEVVSITKVSDEVFDLNLDIESTPRALYEIIVSNVLDLSGNEVLSPGDAVRVAGFQPEVPADRFFDLLAMLPDMNVDEDDTEDLRKFIGCYQEVGDLLLCEIDEFGDILDPDTAPENIVDAMLRDLGNPFDFELSLIDKRRLIQVLVPIYTQKGTDPGIINAIRFFMGIEVTITTPADAGSLLGVGTLGGTFTLGSSSLGDLLTFVVHVPQTLTADELARMTKIVDYMMRGECHFLIQAPSVPGVVNHWSLGLSRLGMNTILHP